MPSSAMYGERTKPALRFSHSWRPDDYDEIAQHDRSIDAISSGCRTHKKSNIENDDYAP